MVGGPCCLKAFCSYMQLSACIAALLAEPIAALLAEPSLGDESLFCCYVLNFSLGNMWHGMGMDGPTNRFGV